MQSAELKLRNLAAANAGLVDALTWPDTAGNPLFQWFDRQLAQGDVGKKSDGRAAVTVRRVSTLQQPFANMGQLNTPSTLVRFQIDCISYNAEQARQVALLVKDFMNSVSLSDPGEFHVPAEGPANAPNLLLNERGGMIPQVQPPAYTQMQDWRVRNVDTVP